MRGVRRCAGPVLLCVMVLGAGKSGLTYLQKGDVDAKAIVGPPPAEGSAAAQADLAALLEAQKERTAAEVARVKVEASGTAFYIGQQVLGKWFTPQALPETAKLLEGASNDLNYFSEKVKRVYDRKRPYEAHADQVHPCLKPVHSPSYPSGHATRGVVWAAVLGELFPEHRAEFEAVGKRFGDDRVIAGVHYPSDVAAGQRLGAEVAKKLLANEKFRADLARAKRECQAAEPAPAGAGR